MNTTIGQIVRAKRNGLTDKNQIMIFKHKFREMIDVGD
jgi:hypothetical protein